MYMHLFVKVQLNENAVGGGVRWVYGRQLKRLSLF
jgi:hypothetical protein